MKKASFKAMILLLLVLASSAMAQLAQFYFLPPYDPDWMRKTPNVVDLDDNYRSYPMKVDPAGCGWFVLDGAELNTVRSHNIVIWPGKYVASAVKDETPDRIGANGLQDGPDTWTGTPKMPVPIKLSEQTNMFFDPATGWNPGRGAVDTKRCTYHMAGLIYDTDVSKFPSSFTRYNKDTQYDSWMGIRRGIVQPTLIRDPVTKVPKMQWNDQTDKVKAASWTKTDFEEAFSCTQGKNALVCYDVPFARDSKGLWTFASDYLCSDETLDLKPNFFNSDNASTGVNSLCTGAGRSPMLSFAPGRLNNYNGTWKGVDDPEPLDSRCTYATCRAAGGDCSASNIAQTDEWGDVPPAVSVTPFYGQTATCNAACNWTPPDNRITRINPACYEKGLSSTSMTGACGAPYTDGHFAGDAPEGRANEGPNVWDWNARDKYMMPKMNTIFKENPNSFFCFETHATFEYEQGQEFYFSGDDDIWVFINDNLVIDLGGCHLASPGYVALDSIGRVGSRWQGSQQVSGNTVKPNYEPLIEGTKYPIDIFFCDRRSNASNIRISTNMYIQQENGLIVTGDAKGAGADICVEQSGSGTCASLLDGSGGTTGSQKICSGLKDWIEFYLVNRSGTTRYPADTSKGLAAGDGNCVETANANELLCFGGVTINMETGKAWVTSKDVVGLPGTWYLYVRVKKDNNRDGLIEPEKVATITTSTFVGVAWGDIKDGNTSLTDVCKRYSEPSITAVTGELVPVCFSSGEQDKTTKTFYTEEVKDIGGRAFKLKTDGFLSTPGNYRLKVYYDSLGEQPAEWGASYTLPGGTGEAPRPNSGSVPGVLVLWVTGEYDQDMMSVDYKVNVTGKSDDEAVKLVSIIPKLQWIKAPHDTIGLTSAQTKYSKWVKDGDPTSGPYTENGVHSPAWVGQWVRLHLRAYNDRTNKTCTTCNYPLILGSATANGLGQTGGSLINTQNMEIKNGEAALDITGRVEIMDPSKAEIVVRSIATALADAKWTDLQFQEPPTPFPKKAEIFDDDGDGIGDRLVITYNRLFRRDSLPNAIEVKWAKDTVITYTIGKRTLDLNVSKDSIYTDANIDTNENVQYWTKHFRGVTDAVLRSRAGWDKTQMMPSGDGDGDVIELKIGNDKSNPEPGVIFSKDVLTRSDRSDNGMVYSWASFDTKVGGATKKTTVGLSGSIYDSIPAIVVNARYAAGEIEGCGSNRANPCRDRVILEFSEPIKMDPNAGTATNEEVMNAFAYRLFDYGGPDVLWNIIDGVTIGTTKAVYNNSRIERPYENGDSIVTFTFNRWRSQGDNSPTPMPLDSVKFAALGKGYAGFAKNILVDLKGNSPNPNEKGRPLGGRRPFSPDKLPIGEIDPNYYPGYVDDIKKTLDKDGSKGYDDNLFNKDRPIELLPVPPDCDVSCIKIKYPGTIGMVFNPDVASQISDLEAQYSITISDGDITLYPRVFFHTNLGNYVADRVFPDGIKCNDPIFPRNEKTQQPSCRDNKSKFYIAWDMKDMKGRFVGTGAYVGIYDFYWDVYINAPSYGVVGLQRQESIERKVEMHGVKRVKGVKAREE